MRCVSKSICSLEHYSRTDLFSKRYPSMFMSLTINWSALLLSKDLKPKRRYCLQELLFARACRLCVSVASVAVVLWTVASLYARKICYGSVQTRFTFGLLLWVVVSLKGISENFTLDHSCKLLVTCIVCWVTCVMQYIAATHKNVRRKSEEWNSSVRKKLSRLMRVSWRDLNFRSSHMKNEQNVSIIYKITRVILVIRL